VATVRTGDADVNIENVGPTTDVTLGAGGLVSRIGGMWEEITLIVGSVSGVGVVGNSQVRSVSTMVSWMVSDGTTNDTNVDM